LRILDEGRIIPDPSPPVLFVRQDRVDRGDGPPPPARASTGRLSRKRGALVIQAKGDGLHAQPIEIPLEDPADDCRLGLKQGPGGPRDPTRPLGGGSIAKAPPPGAQALERLPSQSPMGLVAFGLSPSLKWPPRVVLGRGRRRVPGHPGAIR